MVPPEELCNKHLLGEHGELHKFLHNWRKRHRVDGRLAGNAMEPGSYKTRHDELAAEMLTRGMNHQSPLEQPDFSYLPLEQQRFQVDVEANRQLLVSRCKECETRGYTVQRSVYNHYIDSSNTARV